MESWFKIILPKDFSLEKFYNNPMFLGIEETENVFLVYFKKDIATENLLKKYKLQKLE